MRKKNKTKISLFAFQDIITSTTGILILIAIILTFFLKIGADKVGTPPPTGPAPQDLPGLTNMIAAIEEGNDHTNGVIATWAGRNSAQIESDIEGVIDRINQYSNRVNEINANNTEAAALTAANQAKTNSITHREMELARITNEIARIQGTVRSFAAANRLFVIPEIPLGKNLILVVLGGKKIELVELAIGAGGKPQTKKDEFKEPGMRAALLDALRVRTPKNKYHVVLYVRPSGMGDFKQLTLFGGDEIRNLGFSSLGWDPLEETAVLDFD